EHACTQDCFRPYRQDGVLNPDVVVVDGQVQVLDRAGREADGIGRGLFRLEVGAAAEEAVVLACGIHRHGTVELGRYPGQFALFHRSFRIDAGTRVGAAPQPHCLGRVEVGQARRADGAVPAGAEEVVLGELGAQADLVGVHAAGGAVVRV